MKLNVEGEAVRCLMHKANEQLRFFWMQLCDSMHKVNPLVNSRARACVQV